MSKNAKKDDKALVTSPENQYSVSKELAADFEGMGLGAGDEIDTMDILIPNLMLTQGLTTAVAEGKAQVGRYINSVNNEDVGDAVEAIVIQSYKVWQEFKTAKDGGKDEYIGTVEYYGNEHLPYTFVDDEGADCSRTQVLGFYVLLLEEIKKGLAFPYTITFKKGSKQAGRELTSEFAKLRSVELPSFAKVFTFGSELIKDKYTYYRKTVDMGRDITREELESVKSWIKELKENKDRLKVDDTETQEDLKDEPRTVEGEVTNKTAGGGKF